MRVRVNFNMSARLHIIHFPLGWVDVAWLIAPDFREAVRSSPRQLVEHDLPCAHLIFFPTFSSFRVKPSRLLEVKLREPSLCGIPTAPTIPLIVNLLKGHRYFLFSNSIGYQASSCHP